MDIQYLLKLAASEAAGERITQGQTTLGALQDALGLLPQDMPCTCDDGANFGDSPVTYEELEPYTSEYYSHNGYSEPSSDTAYPSAYRGYYCDCTFNLDPGYAVSTVGHVLAMVNEAIGRSFDGYKGGVNEFTRGTLVWGGSTSRSSSGDSRMIAGIKVMDDTCVLLTRTEED